MTYISPVQYSMRLLCKRERKKMASTLLYSAHDIAPYFIKKGVSPLKLQKLLYYSQVWSFVKSGNKLFKDDIKAWIYGPVVKDIWHKFRYMRRSDVIPQNNHFFSLNDNLDNQTKHHLDNIWASYGHLSGADLVDLTHGELPWRLSRIGLLYNQPSDNSIIIDVNTTKDYQLDSFGNIPFALKPQLFGQFTS